MASSSASPSVLRDLCHALAGDFGATFSLVERGGQTEPSGKENGEAKRPLSKTRRMATPSTPSASSSPADLDGRDPLDAALDGGGGDRALTSRRHRRTRHRLRARMATENASSNSDPSDSSSGEQLSAIASLGATAAFLEAAARVLTGGAAATTAAEACALGWELSRLLEEYRECVLELEARVSEEEEEAAKGNEAEASSSSSSAPASSSSSSSSSLSLPLPVPRIRIHLGEWPVVLEEVAALAELALECMDEEDEEEKEEEEEEGDEKKKRRELLPSAVVPPAAALARAAAALSRCGAPRVEAAAARISAAIERAQLLALADWCCCARGGKGPAGGGGLAGGFWVVSRRRPKTVGGEEEEEAEKSDDFFSSFELVPAALPLFLSAEAARDALFVGCAARAFSSRAGRSTEEEWEGFYGGNCDDDDGGDGENAGEETRRALLSLLSSSSSSSAAADAPEQEDDSRDLSTKTLRPTAVASVLSGARERAERRLFRRCCLRPRLPPPLRGGGRSPSCPPPLLLDPLRAALESLRRVALLGDAALWGAALRSGHLRAALEEKEATESGGGGAGGNGGGGGKGRDAISSALEAAADDARGAATAAALDALFSSRGAAPLRLSVVLVSPEKDHLSSRRGKGGGGRDGGNDREEALWSRLRVRRRERAAWPLGLLPLFSSSAGGGGETSFSSSSSSSSSSSDPWRTVEALFSALLALERASLALEEVYLLLRGAARGRKRALVSASAGNGIIGGSSSSAGTEEGVLLSLWRAHRDAAFAVRGALSHLREDVLSPADRELDAALLRLQREGGAGATAGVAEGAVARPWTLAAAALARWRSRVASSSLLSLSLSASASSSDNPVAEALARLCRACHAIRSAVELASLLEEGEEEEEQEGRGGGGDARALAAASASALLGAAAGASEAARALAAAAAAEAAAQESTSNVDDRGDDFAASHRAMLLGRVSFG